jgi:hypothetical protein
MVKISTFCKSNEISNVAAYSLGAEMLEEVVDIGGINGLLVATFLEAICQSFVDTRFVRHEGVRY